MMKIKLSQFIISNKSRNYADFVNNIKLLQDKITEISQNLSLLCL